MCSQIQRSGEQRSFVRCMWSGVGMGNASASCPLFPRPFLAVTAEQLNGSFARTRCRLDSVTVFAKTSDTRPEIHPLLRRYRMPRLFTGTGTRTRTPDCRYAGPNPCATNIKPPRTWCVWASRISGESRTAARAQNDRPRCRHPPKTRTEAPPPLLAFTPTLGRGSDMKSPEPTDRRLKGS